MISRNLSRRLEWLESRFGPADDPLVIEVQLISSVDRSIVGRIPFTIGGRQNDPLGINDAGQIVGGYDDADGMGHGFLLSSGIYTSLNVPGGIETGAGGINDAGQIVGAYFGAGGMGLGFLPVSVSESCVIRPESTDPICVSLNLR